MTQKDRPTNYTLVGLLAELGKVQISVQREDDDFLAMAVAVFTFQGCSRSSGPTATGSA